MSPSWTLLLALTVSATACGDDPETPPPDSHAGADVGADAASEDAVDTGPCDGLVPPAPDDLAEALAALPQFTISGRVFQNVSNDREGVLTLWISASPDLADLPGAAVYTVVFPFGPVVGATNYTVRAALPASAACLGVGDGGGYWVAAMVDADGADDPSAPNIDTLLGITAGTVGSSTPDDVLTNINVEVR